MKAASQFLLWGPRAIGIAVSLYLALFALDAFEPGQPFLRNLAGFAIHLIPSLLLLAVVALSWRREWIGGIVFLSLGVWYAVGVIGRGHLDWALAISGPLLVTGALYLWSWRHHHGRLVPQS
jgi:hypothetical protein